MPISFQQRLALDQNIWSEAVRQELHDLRVAVPGIVQSFDSAKQTCKVQIAVQEWMNIPLPATNGVPSQSQNNPQWVTVLVEDVPVVIPRAGGFSVTFPIQAGDECLLVFADACIDGWYLNGGVQTQLAKRRHSLSDAFAVFGPWNQTKTLPNYSTSTMQIRSDDGSVVIDIAGSEITITAPAVNVVSSGGVGQNLVTAEFLTWYTTYIQPFLVGLGYAGPPLPTSPSPVTTVFQAE